jgi:ABC-type transporter Mla MlaB component
MLRIIATYQLVAETGAAYMLELKGRLEGDCVDELRRSWRALRSAVTDISISVVTSEVEFVDAAGRVLLAEMHCAGVDFARAKKQSGPGRRQRGA